ncbi:MAG TPA: endolytic transglycosylase MltG [Nocardioidaceae bacterium]
MTDTDTDTSLGVGGLRSTRHRSKVRRTFGCFPILVAVAIIAALGTLGYVKGVDFIKDQLSGPPDYSGDGQKPTVTVEVEKGDTATDIGHTLYDAGVVKSVEAFTDAASADERSLGIQVGRYLLLSKMSARSALLVLIDPDSLIKGPTITIPEGLRAEETLASIAKQTHLTVRQLQTAYHDAAALDLPAYAGGNPEGFLFPSTYEVTSATTAAGLLHQMVATFKQEAAAMHLEEKAKQLGHSPYEVVTVASLVQAESGTADMSKVASVVYNRLDAGMPLELDSTLHYALGLRGDVVTTEEQRKLDSPYNTYKVAGLPPTPINSFGANALEAALNPADTDYLYFVTVNLATGETKFASSYQEHLRNVAQYRRYCETSDEC